MVNTKFIFVTGGVISSLGKGITAASLGRLLKQRGLNVMNQKFDPYLNVDPSSMSPTQHGEVFVTDDGSETDLDLGHYERFTDTTLDMHCSNTMGKIYDRILKNERDGKYMGGTVQVIPTVTNAIKAAIKAAAENNHPDVLITEIGGTVGDIESLPVIEAARQLRRDLGPDNVMYIHMTLVPYLSASYEAKTKPTQHSVKELRSIGIQPNAIICRSDRELDEATEAKIALFCDIDKEAVVQMPDVESLYDIPLKLKEQGLDQIVVDYFGLKCEEADTREWEEMTIRAKTPKSHVSIALVGKYVELPDSYLSAIEALKHGGILHQTKVDIDLIYSGDITSKEKAREKLSGYDGIFVPHGFGSRVTDGLLYTVEYARNNKVPFFGEGLGMQMAAVEFARNVLDLDAGSEEAQPERREKVIHYARKGITTGDSFFDVNGTMRLGAYPTTIKEDTLAYKVYNTKEISERHRHRLEFNNQYIETFEKGGMILSGINERDNYVDILEIKDHPWFMAVSYQPEFKSRPNRPHPIFAEFVGAAIKFAK